MSDNEEVTVKKESLQILFDVAVNSLDFGSGFWEQDDIDAARYIAEKLDICPMLATPGNMRNKYPDCEGTKSWKENYVPFPGWRKLEYIGHDPH